MTPSTTDFHRLPRPGLPRPRGQRGQRQRRAVRAAAEPARARAGGARRRRLRPHRQDLRRLGDPAAARARPRLGRRPARRAGGGARRRRRHRLLPRQLPALRLRRGGLGRGLPAGRTRWQQLEWTTLVQRTACAGDQREPLPRRPATAAGPTSGSPSTPTAGVARFRVHGEAVVDPRYLDQHRRPAGAGERRPAAGHLRRLLLLAGEPDPARPGPDHGRGLGERAPARRRERLGAVRAWPPGACRCCSRSTPPTSSATPRARSGSARPTRSPARSTTPDAWWDLVPRRPVLVDTRHRFLVPSRTGPATHLRVDVYPDGGLSRLRCFGELPGEERERLERRFEESLPTGTASSRSRAPHRWCHRPWASARPEPGRQDRPARCAGRSWCAEPGSDGLRGLRRQEVAHLRRCPRPARCPASG